jgi:hypothetical protein
MAEFEQGSKSRSPDAGETPTLAPSLPPCYRLITSKTGCSQRAWLASCSAAAQSTAANSRQQVRGEGRGGAPHDRAPPTRHWNPTSHRPLLDGYRHRKLKPSAADIVESAPIVSSHLANRCQNMPRPANSPAALDISSTSTASPLHRLPVNPRRKKVSPDERKRVATA